MRASIQLAPLGFLLLQVRMAALAQRSKQPLYGRRYCLPGLGTPGQTLSCVQFALLAFLLGHSLEAFGQWKALLRLLLSCEQAPFRTHSTFYAQALDAVHAQLSHCLANSRSPAPCIHLICVTSPHPISPAHSGARQS